MGGGISIKNLTRRPTPRFSYEEIAKAVLPGWEISLVYVGETRAKQLNESLRKKSYVPNVLSYQVGSKSGEVIICLAVLEREAPRYDLEPMAYCLYLFIHGLLHLKGWAHSATMERREQALLARFIPASSSTSLHTPAPHETTHRNRHRHRHLPGQTGRRRRGR